SPSETEEAVTMLESLAAQDPKDALALSDLAAAYQVRAQREDRPADLLRSFAAAKRAVALAGQREARLNLALAGELLELHGAPGAVSWTRIRQQLAAAESADPSDFDRLVGTFPDAAQRYLEEEIVPSWAARSGKEAARRLA